MRFWTNSFQKGGGEPGFADARFAGNQHHLTVAALRPRPAPQQQFGFFLAPDEESETARMQCLEPAFDSALPQRQPGAHGLGKTFELSGGEVPQLKEIAKEPAGCFGNDNRIRLSNSLQTRSEVWRLANDRAFASFAQSSEIADDDQPSGDTNTGLQQSWRFYRAQGYNHLEARAHRSLGVILVGLGVAKVYKHAIAQILRHETAETANGFRDAFMIGRDEFSQVFRIHPSGECGRTNQVREHHGDLPALGRVPGSRRRWRNRSRRRDFLGRFEMSDRAQQL